jgi:alpha-galactosidase
MGRFKGARGTQCPFSAIFWGGIPSEELKERLAGILSYDLPFDYCWVDAGWYEPLRSTTTATQSADWGNVGTWEVSSFYHPKGYRDVTDFLHERGMKFQLWFEPERMRRSVCEWTNYLWTNSPEDNDVMIDIGKDEVCDELIERISKVIREVGVDCYRQDFNFNPLATWTRTDQKADPNGERSGATEVHHINNLWRFWDTLLERFPHLLIDNCAGGGHRIDIEMLSRSVTLWRSDYQCIWDVCPEANQNSNMRAAWWYPYSGIGYGPTLGDTYSFRSAYTNGMTVRTWEHADPEWRVAA